MTIITFIVFPLLLGSTDKESFTPLHIASKMGHTAIVVALIEEGNADINQRGGDKSDTPLMLSVRIQEV